MIVDVGADWGSSVYWFLQRRAQKVIAFESNPTYNALLRQLTFSDNQVEVHGAWNGEYVPGDCFKCDIEGGEVLLTEDVLDRYPQFAVALHPTFISAEELKRLHYLVTNRGAKETYRTGDGREIVYTKAL